MATFGAIWATIRSDHGTVGGPGILEHLRSDRTSATQQQCPVRDLDEQEVVLPRQIVYEPDRMHPRITPPSRSPVLAPVP